MISNNLLQFPKIFADTSDIKEIEALKKLGIIHGITTNPLIVAKEAGNESPIKYYQELAVRFPDLPISIQLLDSPLDELLELSKAYAALSSNIVIKIPMFTDGRGLTILSTLSSEGIKTNITGLMTTEQVALSLLAGAGIGPTYVSLFFNRIKDGGGNPQYEISRTKQLIKGLNFSAEIIVGSIRRGQDVVDAMIAGTHIVTVTPKVLWEMIEHPKTVEFIVQSQEAWNQLLSKKTEIKSGVKLNQKLTSS